MIAALFTRAQPESLDRTSNFGGLGLSLKCNQLFHVLWRLASPFPNFHESTWTAVLTIAADGREDRQTGRQTDRQTGTDKFEVS